MALKTEQSPKWNNDDNDDGDVDDDDDGDITLHYITVITDILTWPK